MSNEEPVDKTKPQPNPEDVVETILEIAASIATKFAAEIPGDGNLQFLYARAVAGAVGHLTAHFVRGLKGDAVSRLEVRAMAERGLILLESDLRGPNATPDAQKPEADRG